MAKTTLVIRRVMILLGTVAEHSQSVPTVPIMKPTNVMTNISNNDFFTIRPPG